MKKKKIYAVVDLETTGTKMDGTNRIIQFSCVFVQNNEIINSFNSLVNPMCAVPDEILNLTGISAKDLRKAPIFEDLAGTIYSLLQDTIFVAHNIQFDYRFLNQELERVGYPSLELEGIDTVQLSQILFPCLGSYRLQDLSQTLKITHDHPHQADSDAQVTSKLLMKLMTKVKQLPDTLLKQLQSMSNCLIYETGKIFNVTGKKDENKYQQVGKLTLKRIEHSKETNQKTDLKIKWPENFEKRKEQQLLFKDVFQTLNKNNGKDFFNAPTGIGKTLGYLLPSAVQAAQGQKFVISTTTNALQNQLIEKEFVQLNNIYPNNLKVVSIKGSQHYIDIDKFARTLNQTQNDYTTLVQMRILVWLSQTETGDLDELQLTVQQLPLFDEIIHHGVESLNPESPYYNFDFMRRRAELIRSADFVVTNHAYLVHHIQELGKNKTLIIDEAQQLIPIVLQKNNEELDLDEIKIISDTLLTKIESQISFSFRNLIFQQLLTQGEYQKILAEIQAIDHLVPEIRDRLFQQFVTNHSKKNILEIPINFNKIFGFMKENWYLWIKIQYAIQKLVKNNQKIYQKFIQALDQRRLDSKSFNLFKSYFQLCDQLEKSLKNWKYLSLDELEKGEKERLFWLSNSPIQENSHLRIHFGLLEAKEFLNENVYPFFSQVLFFSGNQLSVQTERYLRNQLGFTTMDKFYYYNSSFDYQHHSELIVLDDAPDITKTLPDKFIDYVSETIYRILSTEHRQTMILFNSNEMIEKVYSKLTEKLAADWEILAQGITGTTEKLKKRFSNVNSVSQVLLATGSFWEGIDLPGDKLEMLIIPRLPFQAFNSTYNQIRYRKAEQNGGNAFNDIALPEAIMKFDQGIGRLIRTQTDRGIAIVLDSRISNKNYGKKFLETLPEQMPIIKASTSKLEKLIDDFYEKDV